MSYVRSVQAQAVRHPCYRCELCAINSSSDSVDRKTRCCSVRSLPRGSLLVITVLLIEWYRYRQSLVHNIASTILFRI